MHHAQSDGEINDAAEDYWCQNAHWQLCDDFAEEVGAHGIHIVVDFSQEDRPLVWEDQNDVLDGVESNSHGDEEKSAVSILYSLWSTVNILEKNDSENSSDYRHNEFNIGCLRQPERIEEVSFH